MAPDGMITSSKEMTSMRRSWNWRKRERIRGTDKARERGQGNLSTRENRDRGKERDMGGMKDHEDQYFIQTESIIVNIYIL